MKGKALQGAGEGPAAACPGVLSSARRHSIRSLLLGRIPNSCFQRLTVGPDPAPQYAGLVSCSAASVT